MMTISYKTATKLSVYAEDAYYDIIVDEKYVSGKAWELDRMNDTNMSFVRKEGKVRITITPTDKYHNTFEDYNNLEAELDVELARKLFLEILNADHVIAMWFAKDMLSYAAKTGKLI